MSEEKTVFCRGGGCTAKLGPAALNKVLEKLPKQEDPNLLVGFGGCDDGAVYRLGDDLAIVQTLDFFPPMVEDPHLFGQIAAANALSDVYAMGGQVKTALNIVCFPETMDLNILGKILLGGSEKVQEAGGVLAGGHSIADSDVKYGLSVTGVVHPDQIWSNEGCQEGDVLILTKPLGVGLVCTAARMNAAAEKDMELAVRSMTTLNKYGAEILKKYRIHGCTDVTGFGFLAHLCEMVGERYTAFVDQAAVPFIPGCPGYVEEFYLTAAAQRNRNHVQEKVKFGNVSFAMEEILFDPQTSGGLLASVAAADGPAALEEIRKLGLPCGIVGRIGKREGRLAAVVE
ncbi:MAG TPA: selenide, water dikinase SelD [Candidatus Caccovicinus merdipullorum]|uniref:Selenide, water dikinase n=1 Tax=Candidatus Caccovicinus merdipullorum TaxID=2840724 RepID=A0A9D1KDT2_9FIRM|nr:selenide, water dikinase SelD [Candidatus Caccovicinus merdipullorum]